MKPARSPIISHTVLCFVGLLLLVLSSTTVHADKKEAQSKFTTLDGSRIHFLNYGKGSEALVLIHGWTMNADNWRDNIADLSKRARVIVIDLPGHGLSDKPQTTYSMDYFARAIEAVMRDAKVDRAVLVGHSMGTPIARQFYRKYPQKTLAIVIADGSLRPFGDKALLDNLIAGLRSPKYRDVTGQMLGMMAGGLAAEGRDRINISTANTPQHVLVSAMEGMVNPEIWDEDQITVPVLAIMAKNPFYPPNVEESFRKIAPAMEFHMWPDVGHFVMMEKPDEFNRLLAGFLEKIKY